MTVSNIFDFMGILLDKEVMGEYDFAVNGALKDTGEKFMLCFKNSALLQFENTLKESADLSITTGKNALFYILSRDMEKFSSLAEIEGDQTLLELIMENLNQFNPGVDGPLKRETIVRRNVVFLGQRNDTKKPRRSRRNAKK